MIGSIDRSFWIRGFLPVFSPGDMASESSFQSALCSGFHIEAKYAMEAYRKQNDIIIPNITIITLKIQKSDIQSYGCSLM